MYEDLESYAEREELLTYDKYPTALAKTIQHACIDALLRGARNKRAALMAVVKDLQTSNDTISLVKSVIHSQRALIGDSTRVRQVTFAGKRDDMDARELTAENWMLNLSHLRLKGVWINLLLCWTS